MIPALDEAGNVEAAIASAAIPGTEVVVADGGSSDATAERATRSGARVVRSPPGRARQINAGIEATTAEVVLVLHADTRLPPGWKGALVEALRDPGVVGGAFRFRFDRRGARLRLVEWGARLRTGLLAMPYGDQALFVRRTLLDQLGGYPSAPIMEDLDLVRAMKRKGRIARLAQPVTTSARRYQARGVLRTMLRNWIATAGWLLGVDRRRIATWYRP